MKTIKKGIYFLLITLFLTLTACTSEEVVEEEIVEESLTKVKVVRLSYETQGQELRTNNIFKLNASKPINYIFPGDDLAFTVEIEDPDFEFISLLSLKLNDQVIRANTSDAITSTRDCGLNICVDFPYPVSSGVTTYSLTELKFARLGSDDPIDALIENDAVSVSIEIWEDPVSPYVVDAVKLLNETLELLAIHNDDDYITITTGFEEWVISQLSEEGLESIYLKSYYNRMVEVFLIDDSFDELLEEEKKATMEYHYEYMTNEEKQDFIECLYEDTQETKKDNIYKCYYEKMPDEEKQDFIDSLNYYEMYNELSEETQNSYLEIYENYEEFYYSQLRNLTKHLMILNFDQVTSYTEEFWTSEYFPFIWGGGQQGISIRDNVDTEQGDGTIIYYPNARVISLHIFSLNFKDAFFSNLGNTIYFNHNGETTAILTFGLKTQIVLSADFIISTEEAQEKYGF